MVQTKLFSHPHLAKFWDTSAKPFFPCQRKISQRKISQRKIKNHYSKELQRDGIHL